MVEFMQQGTRKTFVVYCETVKKKLHKVFQNKRHGMLTSRVHVSTYSCSHWSTPEAYQLEVV
jgi:hypothetical protein